MAVCDSVSTIDSKVVVTVLYNLISSTICRYLLPLLILGISYTGIQEDIIAVFCRAAAAIYTVVSIHFLIRVVTISPV